MSESQEREPMDLQTDEEIMMEYIAAQDQKAIEAIFERYKNRILNFCLRILGNRADAEDITADVFLALFSNKYQYDPQAKFSTWLFTVARNRCIDQIRRRKNIISMWFTSKNGGTVEQWDVEDSSHLSREELEKKETQQQVRLAIAKLPVEQKEAIVLREYHSFSYAQISQVLDCSLEKVKILIYRGREQLRGELSSLIEEDQS